MKTSDLDDLLGLASQIRPAPSDQLIDRVLADAVAQQPAPGRAAGPAPAARQGWLSRLSMAFGGGPILAGVCGSMVVGLAIGYLNPATLDYLAYGLTEGLTGAETGAETGTVEFFPSADLDADFLITEG